MAMKMGYIYINGTHKIIDDVLGYKQHVAESKKMDYRDRNEPNKKGIANRLKST